MFYGVGVSCRILYSIVTSVGEERADCSANNSTNNYAVSVRRGFLFLLVLGMGCVILLWHSLSLPYNDFTVTRATLADPSTE